MYYQIWHNKPQTANIATVVLTTQDGGLARRFFENQSRPGMFQLWEAHPDWRPGDRWHNDESRLVDEKHNTICRNARFWEWINNGWVKITLRPGQSLSHSKYSTDEEGYSAELTSWIHDGDEIRREWNTSARDCDGQISRNGSEVCPISRLASVPAMLSDESDSRDYFDHMLIYRADWQTKDKTRVYDAYAEAMNY